jgi:fatty acid desaturase/cytochrome b involved in lipid metabolism
MQYLINEKNTNVANRSKTKILTEKDLIDMKNNNILWISIDDKVYDVGNWLEKHPGGDLIIRHFLFRDATEQFSRFHPKEVKEKILPYLQIGILEKKISIDSPMIKEFREIENKLMLEGYFDTNYNFYILESIKGISSLLIGILMVIYGPEYWINYIIAACFMAFCWHQLAFVAHDTGHNGITHNLTFDNYFGIFLASCLSGLSIGWWKDSHNIHHVVTNDPTHDPDIQHLPFFAVSEKFIEGVDSTYHKAEFKVNSINKVFVKIQPYLYYLIMMFARFNLYIQGIKFLLLNDRAKYRKTEIFAMIFFGCWFYKLVSFIEDWKMRLVFILLANGITFILHVQITISHFAMDTAPVSENEDFVTHQLRTSMDVDCPVWLDWFHGGLQYQVVHHLMPRLPRHNLRKVRDMLLPFFKKWNLNYQCYDFTYGNIMVLNQMSSISKKVVEFFANKNNKKIE